jgi:hypothetical protein
VERLLQGAIENANGVGLQAIQSSRLFHDLLYWERSS